MVWRRSLSVGMLVGVTAALAVAGAAATRPQKKPAFDVVDFKVWRAGEHPSRYRNDVQRQNPGRVWAQYAPLSSLLRYAFNLGVSAPTEGLPNWAGASLRDFQAATMFYVDARMPATTTDEQSRVMMQTLLQERFHLVWHWTKKPTKVLELTSAPGELKLHPPDPATDKGPTKGVMVCPEDVNGCSFTPPRDMTMEEFAASLPRLIFGLPVVDKTGLTGKFYVPQMTLLLSGESSASLPSATTELHEMTGLRLHEASEMLPVLVIDKVTKPSDAAPAGRLRGGHHGVMRLAS